MRSTISPDCVTTRRSIHDPFPYKWRIPNICSSFLEILERFKWHG
jgi:hypothetical protein